FRLNDAAMKKPEIRVERVTVEQREIIQLARPAMDPGRRPVACGVVVRDSLSQRQTRRVGRWIGGRRIPGPALLHDGGRCRPAEDDQNNREKLRHETLLTKKS